LQGREPDSAEDAVHEQVLTPQDERTWYPVPAQVSGYIQGVDQDAILDLARNYRTIVRMERGVGGAFAVPGAALASLALTYPQDRARIERRLAQVRHALGAAHPAACAVVEEA
jgi:uncharacterized membrane protein